VLPIPATAATVVGSSDVRGGFGCPGKVRVRCLLSFAAAMGSLIKKRRKRMRKKKHKKLLKKTRWQRRQQGK